MPSIHMLVSTNSSLTAGDETSERLGSPTDGEENEASFPECVNNLTKHLRKGQDFARNKLQLKSDRMND